MKTGKQLSNSILILFFLLVVFNTQGQIIDADTIQTYDKIESLEEIHSPRKATIYSAILPGLGQVYNKKWWKVPLIYGGFIGIGYFIKWNNDNYQINRKAYDHLTDTLTNTNFHVGIAAEYRYDLNDPTSIRNFKEGLTKRQEYYRRNRDLLIISMAGFYALNIIDASVDAHLFNFDISDDLTMHWQPTVVNINSQNIYCINCKFNF